MATLGTYIILRMLASDRPGRSNCCWALLKHVPKHNLDASGNVILESAAGYCRPDASFPQDRILRLDLGHCVSGACNGLWSHKIISRKHVHLLQPFAPLISPGYRLAVSVYQSTAGCTRVFNNPEGKEADQALVPSCYNQS